MCPARRKDKWELELYVAGGSRRSQYALQNLKEICENYLKGHYSIRVFDLSLHPEIAFEKRITVVPTLVKVHPFPPRTLVGDLSQIDKVLVGLDLIGKPPGRGYEHSYSTAVKRNR